MKRFFYINNPIKKRSFESLCIKKYYLLRKKTHILKRKNHITAIISKILVMVLPFMSTTLQGQTQINNYGFNNNVYAMAKTSDGSTYVGGAFTSIGDYSGQVAKLNTDGTQAFTINDAKIEGVVKCIVAIPSGGWYVGGDFLSVNNISRNRLARINADGSLHPFNLSVNGVVHCLAIDATEKVYLGGVFSTVGGVTRSRFACLNADGTLNNFNPIFDSPVYALTLDIYNNLYVGGSFGTVNSIQRTKLAKFNPNRTLNSFNPYIVGFIFSIKINSAGELFVGGSIIQVNNMARSMLAKFSADGTLNPLIVNLDNEVYTISIDTYDNIYIGGYFTTVNNIERNFLAKLNPDGSLNGFNPGVNGEVTSLYNDNLSNIYVGGVFTQLNNSIQRNNFAKFDSLGNLDAFNPSMNGLVNAITITSLGNILAGGNFTTVNTFPKTYLVKFNPNGTLNNSFNPLININLISNVVSTLLVDNLDNLYVGGKFNIINGLTRNNLAKFNPNGTLNDFDPNINNNVFALKLDTGNNLYVGGAFTTIGGISRNRLAKYNANGTLNEFNPNMNYTVSTLLFDTSGNLYAGGGFTTVNGVGRDRVAKFNTDGTLNSFNPTFDSLVSSFGLDASNNLYIGGYFVTVNGQVRNRLAKFDVNGILQAYNPPTVTGGLGGIDSIAVTPSGYVYAGGNFTTVGGFTRRSFSKFNPDGSLNGLTINNFSNGQNVLLDNSKLYLGGSFNQRYQVYEGVLDPCEQTYYQDSDGDGFGNNNVSVTNCQPIGFVTNNTDCDDTVYSLTNICSSIVNLKLYIQGYFDNGMMRSIKFNQDGISPLTDVETITVKLHNSTFPYAIVDTTTAMLKIDGTAICSFPTFPSGSFYIAVSSSNAIQTWSASPVIIGVTPLVYDFTTSQTKAYGNNLIELESGVYGIYSGDINQDEVIDASDAVDLANDIENSAYGVIATDLNGDGAVDNSDDSIFSNNANDSIFSSHP